MGREQTVFVVDDDQAIRDSMAALIGTHGLPVQTYDSAEAFLASYDGVQPGCLVVDMQMLGMSGLDLLEALGEKEYQLPVIIVTGHADVPSAVKAMSEGAVTYLEKSGSQEELLNHITRALKIESDARGNREQHASIRRRLSELSDSEREVLEALVAGKPNKVIASHLEMGLRTVELRRANIFKTMGVRSLAELIQQVMVVRNDPGEASR